MKYAWIEDIGIIDGPEIFQVVSHDPPQYTEEEILQQVPYDPPRYKEGPEIYQKLLHVPPQYENGSEIFQPISFDPPQYDNEGEEIVIMEPYDPPRYEQVRQYYYESFDPPQYEQVEEFNYISYDPPQFKDPVEVFQHIPHDPPQYEQIEGGTGNGVLTGLNRRGSGEERTGKCPNDRVATYGIDEKKYRIINYDLVPIPQEEADIIDAERQAEIDLVAEKKQIDVEYATALSIPVDVEINNVTYQFTAGFESSLYIDNARVLADNLNESEVELWDTHGDPHIFTKQEALQIAIAVGSSFRNVDRLRRQKKKEIKDRTNS